jgi:2-oxoglutarate ferredoxin oxidoreductase subunit beta
LAFVRILQRCPHFVADNFDELRNEPSHFKLLLHQHGILVDDRVQRLYPNHCEHDPGDRNAAMIVAADERHTALGLLYRTASHRYDETTASGLGMSNSEKLAAAQAEIDRFRL